MADFNIQPVATQIKPVQGMSLGDMVNMARGVQAYQQAEQINPLALQQQQQATRTGEIALGVEEQKDKERRNVMTVISDPQYRDANGRLKLDAVGAKLYEVAPLTAPTVMQGLTTLNKAQTEADAAVSELNQSDRALLAQPLSVAGYQGIKDPNVYARIIKETQELNKNNPRLVSLGDSYLTQLQFADPEKLPDIAIRASQNLLKPTETKALAPSIAVTESGRTVTTQPAVGGMQPGATVGVAGGLQPSQPSAPAVGGAPVGAGAEVAPGMRLPYQVRRADQPYMPEPSEKKDLESGIAYRDRLVVAQTNLAQNRRNVDEVLTQTSKIADELTKLEREGGKPFEWGQKIRRIWGDTNYDMLAKDLANLALSNIQAMGGVSNTVAGLDMQQVANGTIKVPPDVLTKIARRVQADQTNMDMQANGSQIFGTQFGDNNMKAYQQAWNANADTKIFEGMNIIRDIADPKQRKDELEKLFPDAQKRKTFLKKYKNLKSMSETGLPIEPLTKEDR